jgi:Flp pilus assembly protein TadD
MKARLTLNVLTASMLLAACAQTQTRQELNIQPLQEVRHSYDQAKAQYELGRYYHGQLRYGRAIEAYRRALEMDPGMVDAMNALGAAYAESGNLALAREQFEAALKLQPQSVYTYNNLGFVNYLAGDYPAAVQAYKQALRLDGRHEKARQNLVLAYDKMGAGEQIARTEVPDAAVAPLPPVEAATQNEPQTAWVKISPAIYEMHSAVAPVNQHAATTPAKVADAAPVARAAAVEAAPLAHSATVETAEAPRVATTSPVPTVPSPVAVQRTGTKQPVMTAIKAPLAAVVVPQMVKVAADANPLRGVEVSNGNGIRGMAAMVARYFSGKGVQQARLTNQKPFAERRTRIEYRPGSAEEAARINKLLPKAAPQVASNSLRPGIRVRLVLGHDLGRDIAAWDNQPEAGLVTAGLTGMDLPQL